MTTDFDPFAPVLTPGLVPHYIDAFLRFEFLQIMHSATVAMWLIDITFLALGTSWRDALTVLLRPFGPTLGLCGDPDVAIILKRCNGVAIASENAEVQANNEDVTIEFTANIEWDGEYILVSAIWNFDADTLSTQLHARILDTSFRGQQMIAAAVQAAPAPVSFSTERMSPLRDILVPRSLDLFAPSLEVVQDIDLALRTIPTYW